MNLPNPAGSLILLPSTRIRGDEPPIVMLDELDKVFPPAFAGMSLRHSLQLLVLLPCTRTRGDEPPDVQRLVELSPLLPRSRG